MDFPETKVVGGEAYALCGAGYKHQVRNKPLPGWQQCLLCWSQNQGHHQTNVEAGFCGEGACSRSAAKQSQSFWGRFAT
ncbi:hypothetical protein, partial [Pseudomonas sp. ANT_J12]|uniref:hypothetical protein n=1 Tax=Pseudomonas sp. ANT_J12 TaxID=2597351 RepID=UPI001C49C326